MSKLLKVLIVSQQSFLRQGIQHFLSTNHDLDINTAAAIDDKLLSEMSTSPPDISIIDIDGDNGNGMEVAKRFSRSMPDTGLIILSSNHDDNQLFQALKLQVSAYLKKEAPPEELLNAVRVVARGERPIEDIFTSRQDVATQVLHKFQELSADTGNEHIVSPLTPRETEILDYIARGFLNKQIAEKLGISEQTIKNHVSNILRKLNANARTEAVVLAIKQRLINIT